MVKMERDKFGYYGLIVKPTFEEVLDTTKKPLRIPIPDRKAKREALNFYRAKLLELQQSAMGYDLTGMQHAVDGQTIPEALHQVEQIGPSKSADDVVFDNMKAHARSDACAN